MKIQIELRRPRWLPARLSWRTRIIACAVALLTIAVPTAWAIHDFADVPNDHQFHSQISLMKTAGITTGCGGGNYCPSEFVRRDAMAAFLQRGLGRGGSTLDAGNALTTTPTDVATRTITTPGAGFVLVNAHAMAFSCSTYPCNIFLTLRNAGTGVASFFYANTLHAAGQYTALSNGHVFAVSGAGTHTFAARMWTSVTSASSDVTLTAVWVPFGSTGGATAAIEQQGTQSR